MTPSTPRRLVAAVAAAALLAGAARGQDPDAGAALPRLDEPPPPGVAGSEGMRASIQGVAITAHDVLVEARVLMLEQGAPPSALEDPPDDARQAALARLAREILLAEEARRLGLEISDFELDEMLRLAFDGKAPDMAALAEATGTTVEFQRDRFRRQLMAQIYSEQRMGRMYRYSQLIPADPRLTRMVSIRPSELKDAFAERRDELAVPPGVRYRLYSFEDLDAASDGVLALGLGRAPEGLLGKPQEETLTVDVVPQRFAGLPLAEWLLEAQAGAVSAPTLVEPTDGRPFALVAQVLERLPAREADFARDQELLRNMLLKSRLERARRELVVEEARKAVVWPRDLFSAPTPVADPR